MKKKAIIFFLQQVLLQAVVSAQQKPLALGLGIFENIEYIEYCLPLPLKEFKELPGSEKAAHSFVNKKNKDCTIYIKGYYSTIVNIDTLYKQTNTASNEEAGKVVTQTELLKNKNCFYAIGYYNNFINKYEFAEVTWVRNDEVVELKIYYTVKEKQLWYDRLKLIIKNAWCR